MMTDKEFGDLMTTLERQAQDGTQDQPRHYDKRETIDRIHQMAKEYNGDDKVVSSLEILERVRNEPEETKMMTGVPSLDKILGGFRPQQVITLTGITKHGKTSFALDLVSKLKENNPTCLLFEEPPEEIIRKFLERGDEVPIFYTPQRTPTRTIDWIEKKIIESKAKFDTKIIFIDHLGYIARSKGENAAYEIEQTMQELKTLAKRWDVIVFLLVHLKKVKLDRNPDLEDLKGSSAIAQESDTVMILWRETERINGEVVITNEATLSIQANRRTGTTGNVHLIFRDGKFSESDTQHAEDDATNTWDSV